MNAKLIGNGAVLDFLDAMMECGLTAFQDTREALIETSILRPNLLTKELYSQRPVSLAPLSERVRTSMRNADRQLSHNYAAFSMRFWPRWAA